MKKKGFIFYPSYFEAIETLSKKNRLLAYEAIARYALYQEEAENLPLRVLAILKVVMPNLDANNQKYNKKVSRSQKSTSEFDEFSGRKVLPPRKDSLIIGDDEFED